jgi:phage baseplate assembly protein gpV
MKKYKTHIIWLLVAIVALVGGFYWGRANGTASRGSFAGAGTFSSSTRRFAGTGGAASGGLAAGQITAMDSSSITLQLANGNSEVVFYTSSTPVSEPTTVLPSTLKVGTNVMVTGTSNSDGSVTAQTIQVRGATGAVTNSGQ